jgi:ligand-binding sensor domain-containing protein
LSHDPLNKYSLESSKVRRLFHDKGGVFWVGTISGLNKWNSATRAFKHLRSRPGHRTSLSNNDGVNAIEQTESGDIWIGTYGGLNRLREEKIDHFLADPSQSNSLSDKDVMSLYAEKQRLWIGTQKKGLDRFDFKTETFKNYHHDPANPKSLSANGITAIKPAKEEQLWIATYGGGLNLFNPKLESFTHFRNDKNREDSLSSDNVLSLLQEQ